MKNANNPQTPGVYTVEKNASDNAVVPVPSAIPAFVGYTEKAEEYGRLLINTPKLITSLREFENYFGGAPPYKFPIKEVAETSYDLTLNGKYYEVLKAEKNVFYLYYSLKMFFLNGGELAYIVSVGTYQKRTKDNESKPTYVPNVITKDALLEGLNALPNIPYPKPTMIVIPDAMGLAKNECYALQQKMIAQAGELKDRIALLDIGEGRKGPMDFNVIEDFRNNMGTDSLSYAIAYYPWLECSVVKPKDIALHHFYQPNEGEKAEPQSWIAIKDLFTGDSNWSKLDEIQADYKTFQQHLMIPPPLDFSDGGKGITLSTWGNAFQGFPASDDGSFIKDKFMVFAALYGFLFDLGNKGTTGTFSIVNTELKSAIQKMTLPNERMAREISNLSQYEKFFPKDAAGSAINDRLSDWGIYVPNYNPYAGLLDDNWEKEAFSMAESVSKGSFLFFMKALQQVMDTCYGLVKKYNDALFNGNQDYQKLLNAAARHANLLPPSGPMAGVYTKVDNSEGVWFAPANRNIEGVISPTVSINNDQQASLNVDVLSGKSVNAIRSFYGRGPAIIWGARTMDGNSLDWRYVNVRRLMIMIEQSIANASSSLVFEPNDASTWTMLESMINNFLHNLWSEGALQGASASDAYSVSVGLGKTMTAQDILEGIMRVQVKVAPAYPAEFIIITYEQEMAKA
jgi:phage tail sheath protein FI